MPRQRLDLVAAGGRQATTRRYQRGRSRAFRGAFALVVVGLIVVDRSKEGDDILLLSALDVLIESSRNGLLLCTVMSQFPGFFNKPVVDGKVSRHNVSHLLYTVLCVVAMRSCCVDCLSNEFGQVVSDEICRWESVWGTIRKE